MHCISHSSKKIIEYKLNWKSLNKSPIEWINLLKIILFKLQMHTVAKYLWSKCSSSRRTNARQFLCNVNNSVLFITNFFSARLATGVDRNCWKIIHNMMTKRNNVGGYKKNVAQKLWYASDTIFSDTGISYQK